MDDYHPVKWNRYTKRWARMPKIWQRLFWRHVERRVALFEDDVAAATDEQESTR